MDILFQKGNWIICFYIIVLLPFQVYDIYKNKDKGYKDYLLLVMYSCFAIIAGIDTFISQKHLMIDSPAFYVVLFVAYIQSILDGFNHKSKRNIIFSCIFTFFILLLIICAL